MKIRTLGIKEIPRLKTLHDRVFNRNITYKYLEWLFKNPYGVIPLGMFDEGKLIAFYCGEMRKWKEHKTAICTIAMVDPDYRKQGLFIELAKELYTRLEFIGCEFITLFANKNIYQLYEKYLDFQPIQLKKYWFEISNHYFHCDKMERLFTSQNDYKKYRYFDHPTKNYSFWLDMKDMNNIILSKYGDQMQLIHYNRFTPRVLQLGQMQGEMNGCKYITSFQCGIGMEYAVPKLIDTWLCIKDFIGHNHASIILDNLRFGMTDTY